MNNSAVDIGETSREDMFFANFQRFQAQSNLLSKWSQMKHLQTLGGVATPELLLRSVCANEALLCFGHIIRKYSTRSWHQSVHSLAGLKNKGIYAEDNDTVPVFDALCNGKE